MRRLNLVSSVADLELDAIRNVLEYFEPVSDLDGLVAVLRRHAATGRRSELVDVIGHSNKNGFVALGNLVIDDRPQISASFSLLIRPWLEHLGVRTIRLLGCSTASTERGRAAMGRIAEATGCQVLGTHRYISRYDYAADGFLEHLRPLSSTRSEIRSRSS